MHHLPFDPFPYEYCVKVTVHVGQVLSTCNPLTVNAAEVTVNVTIKHLMKSHCESNSLLMVHGY